VVSKRVPDAEGAITEGGEGVDQRVGARSAEGRLLMRGPQRVAEGWRHPLDDEGVGDRQRQAGARAEQQQVDGIGQRVGHLVIARSSGAQVRQAR